ncbi:MAG: hypothetical protein GY710_00975 [Desulfobacteraceae bacterium]|nr:hypothetical protein [Desulfobacteraceae bacterium]
MKLFRLPITILLLSIVISCSADPIDKLISSTAMENTVFPLNIFDIQKQTAKSVNGGTLIEASVEVPYDVKRNQVRATILASLKKLKTDYPKTEWFIVYLYPAGKETSRIPAAIHAGRGEYVQQEIFINYLIPSKEEIQRYADKNAKSDNYMISTPKLMSEQEFYKAVGIASLYYDYYKSSRDPNLSYQKAAEQLGMSKTNVKAYRANLLNYYGLGQKFEVIK